ncbi:MAG TPA: BatA and WFA domain-containing protein [Flavobacterium sp.]|jgi:hypothetical protein|nr:BatA and WFA domain-containing protein [Flavobacterium sp.]
MQFKHPELLYFLFLLVIPILVHLFQLRRFKKQYFTNVRFLKELSIQTRKSSKIKKWLLLATRLLLLAALVIAFAQPFFRAKDSNSVTNEMYIVLDNSFSMQAKGQKGELLKRAVEDLLAHVPETSTFSLVTNSETFWNTNIRSVQKDLQNLQYSASPFRIDDLMARINSRKSPYDKDVVIITDAVGVMPKQLQNIDPKSNTYFIVPTAEQRNNISIDSVFLNETMENFYEIGIKLSAYGEAKDVPLALYNNQKLTAKTLVSFDTKQKTMLFTIPKANFNGYAEITDNGLTYDNSLFFSISSPEKTNVLSIGEPAKSAFMSRIYTAGEFNYSNSALPALDYSAIEKQDVIVLNELTEIPQALQTTLKSFVQKGGNVIMIPSAESTVSNLNSFVGNFGSMRFGPATTSEKPVTRIAFGHPLYSGVFEKRIENFQYPVTQKSFTVSSNTATILGYEDQSIFVTDLRNPVSAVYVFAAPINKENSNFQNSPLIVPTFYNMAQTAGRTGISALTIGTTEPLIIDAPLGKDEIVSISNGEENFIPVQQVLSNKVRLTFDEQPQKAGNFSVMKGTQNLKNISFNYDRAESDLSAPDEALLNDYKVIDNIEAVFDTLQNDRTDNELWKWFMILALLFLLAELLIQKFVK